jgi:hypothetical protein
LRAFTDISDEKNPLWETFRIKLVPTLIGFKDGLLIARRDAQPGGGLQKSDLEFLVAILESS